MHLAGKNTFPVTSYMFMNNYYDYFLLKTMGAI
jgi:hypothetical protein